MFTNKSFLKCYKYENKNPTFCKLAKPIYPAAKETSFSFFSYCYFVVTCLLVT